MKGIIRLVAPVLASLSHYHGRFKQLPPVYESFHDLLSFIGIDAGVIRENIDYHHQKIAKVSSACQVMAVSLVFLWNMPFSQARMDWHSLIIGEEFIGQSQSVLFSVITWFWGARDFP